MNRHERVPLGIREQIDGVDPQRGVCNHRREHRHVAVRDRVRGGSVEQIGGIPQHTHQAVVRFAECQGEVELRDTGLERHRSHGQARQVDGEGDPVLERERDLEQRRVRLRANRGESLDDPLEGNLAVAECLQVHVAHTREEVGERGAGVERDPQHQGVDEHPDDVVQCGVPAARDRRADRDVRAARQPRQQQRESRMCHHERRHAVLLRERAQRLFGLARNRELGRGTAIRRDGRSRPIRRERQHIVESGESSTPVVEFTRCPGVRVVRVAENLALPQCVVGVLHGKRRPLGGGPGAACGVGGAHVARQGPGGEPVAADVVHHQHQHMLGRFDREQRDPDRDGGGDIEPAAKHPGDARRQILGGDQYRVEVECHRFRCHDHLHRTLAVVGIHSAQRLVPNEHVVDRGPQGGDVQVAGQPHHHGHVVGRPNPDRTG